MAMLPTMLEDDRRRAGWSVGQAAWRLGLSVGQYRKLDACAPLTELRDEESDLQAVRLASPFR